jgi:hypothetical protein
MEEGLKFHTVCGYRTIDNNKKLLTSAMEDYLETICKNILVDGYMLALTISEIFLFMGILFIDCNYIDSNLELKLV